MAFRITLLLFGAFLFGCASEPEAAKPTGSGQPQTTGDSDANGDSDQGDNGGDTGKGDDEPDGDSDVTPGDEDPVEPACESHGIIGSWFGGFEGEQTNTMIDAILDTEGTASMIIVCEGGIINVIGELSGEICEEFCVPYAGDVEGTYNPETNVMTGAIVDGIVDFTITQVPFEGTMTGSYQDGVISGTWTSTSEGENPLTGTIESAEGGGTWSVDPM